MQVSVGELKGQFRLPERKHRVVGELYTDGPLIIVK